MRNDIHFSSSFFVLRRMFIRVFCLVFLISGPTLQAQTIFWTNTNGGLYDQGANWSQGFVPGSSDDVAFPMPGEYDINFLTPRFVSDLLVTTDAKPTFRNAGLQNEDRYLVVGNDLDVNQEARLTVSGGTGVGRFNLIVDNFVTVNDISLAQSSGTLTVENNSLLSSGSGAIGTIPGVFGSVVLSGDLAEWDIDNSLWIGTQGHGELKVLNGASVNSSYSNSIGSSSGIGQAVVSGSGSDGEPSSWVMDGSLELGFSGQATLDVLDGGFVSNDSGIVGYHGSGFVNVDGSDSNGNPSMWTTGNLLISYFESSETVLTFGDGAQVYNDNVRMAPGGVSEVIVQGTGAGNPSTWSVLGDFSAGEEGYSQIRVLDGAALQTENMTLAHLSGSASFLTMDVEDSLNETSTWSNSGDVYLGGTEAAPGGTAELELRRNANVYIGGTLTIWGPGNVYAFDSVLAANRIDNTHGGSFQMQSNSVIKFNRYDGDFLHDDATLSPGLGAEPATIIGDYTKHAGTTTVFEIGGSAGMHDSLTVTGTADLNGAIELQLTNDFVPASSDTFVVFAAGNMIGLISNVANGQRLNLADGSGSFVVHYGLGSQFAANQIVLSDFEGSGFVVGDVNLDGVVNLLDVEPFVEVLTNGTFLPEADINQDGSVDLLDVEPFVDLLTG